MPSKHRRKAALPASLFADFNPIEQLFAKLKALLSEKAAERSVEGLWNRIASLLDAYPPTNVPITSAIPDMLHDKWKLHLAAAPARRLGLPPLDMRPPCTATC